MRIAIGIALVVVPACTIGTPITSTNPLGTEGEGEGVVAGEGEGEGEGGEGEGEGEGEGADGTGGTFCDMQTLFAANCTVCHGPAPSVSSPDLTNLAALINADSTLYPGHKYVVPGDPASSLLYIKVNGAPPAGLGVQMPQGGHLSVAQIASVSTWIQNGASTTCSAPPPPTTIAPGGDISSHISSGGLFYGTTAPSFLPAGGTCSTSSWWQDNPGQGDSMAPGQACIQCHVANGAGGIDGPPLYNYAGTVSAALHDEDDCRGVGDVLVEILDGTSGATVAQTTTDHDSGNFALEIANPPASYRVRLSLDGRTREMQTVQTVGDCATCHTSAGLNNAPGRIVAP
jgi:mono/diheme cytochrome c family protein